MSTSEATFLGLLFSGIAALITGVCLTRVYWRPELPPYGRRTPTVRVLVHPEEYVRGAPLRAIQSLNLVGTLLLAGAIVVVAYELLRAMRGR